MDLCVYMYVYTCVLMTSLLTKIPDSRLASFSGLVRSLLAVQNSHRKPGLVHHLISAAGRVFMSADNDVCCVAKSYTMELEAETSQARTIHYSCQI